MDDRGGIETAVGINTIAIQRGDTYYIDNVNGTGVRRRGVHDEVRLAGDVGIAGDWDRGRKDSIRCLHPRRQHVLSAQLDDLGVADQAFVYDSGDIGFASRWSTSSGTTPLACAARRPPPRPGLRSRSADGGRPRLDRRAMDLPLQRVSVGPSGNPVPRAAQAAHTASRRRCPVPGSPRTAQTGGPDPATQIAWGNDSVAGTGTPCAAWNRSFSSAAGTGTRKRELTNSPSSAN